MKKTISLFVSFVCFLSIFMIPIHAEDEDLLDYAPSDQTYQMNEYEGILNQIEDLETQRFARSTSFTENQKIYRELLEQKENYKDYIYSLKSLDETVLENDYGYKDDQIDAIKNYDGSEDLTIRAAARVVAALSVQNYWYSSSDNQTYTYVTFSGHWEGTPAIKSYDNIAIGVAGSTANFQRVSSWDTITRQNGTTVSNTSYKYYPMTGVVYSFGVGDPSGGVIKQFNMGYNAQATGKVLLMDCVAAYGHRTIALSGFGLSIAMGSGSVSISASIETNLEWYGTKSNRL